MKVLGRCKPAAGPACILACRLASLHMELVGYEDSSYTDPDADDLSINRFVSVPMDTVDKRLSTESGEKKTEITNLQKKLDYFETTHRNSRQNLEQILKSGGRA